MHVLQQKVSTYSVEAEKKKKVFVPQKRRNEYVLLQKREEISIKIAADIKKWVPV